MIPLELARQYIDDVLSGKEKAPRKVRRVCKKLKPIYDGTDEKYCINTEKVRQIEVCTGLMIMPKGPAAGKTMRDVFIGFQWFFIVSTLCIVHRNNNRHRKHKKVVLEIARKNGKTFIIAVLFILLMFMEPRFSKFYSVAPDGKLSREIYTAITEIIKMSPVLNTDVPKRFRIMRDKILCLPTDSEYTPLNYSNDRLDGKQPNVYLVDEAGGLPNSYAIEAMSSGQLTVENGLGVIISTKYPRVNNPLEDEIAYADRVIDDVEDDETLFALLYEPDDTVNWMTNDDILYHANPLAAHVPSVWKQLLERRKRAIVMRSARENFLCKHCNIAFSAGAEGYVNVSDLQKGRREHIDWRGREVYLGIDLAMTDDNCSVVMLSRAEDGGIYVLPIAFFPEGRMEEKTAAEKFDYARSQADGECFACGTYIVDYAFIEEYILKLEENYGVKILGFGFDRYNCIATAEHLENAGISGGTEIVQHSKVLHAPTKRLSELVALGLVHYEPNKLYEVNFENAKCTYDTNMNRFVNKKKSSGKVDMVVATINALQMFMQDESGELDWAVQC